MPTSAVEAEVLGDLEDEPAAGMLDDEGVLDGRDAILEFDVDDRTDNLGDCACGHNVYSYEVKGL
jgi:hypothetical protein